MRERLSWILSGYNIALSFWLLGNFQVRTLEKDKKKYLKIYVGKISFSWKLNKIKEI